MLRLPPWCVTACCRHCVAAAAMVCLDCRPDGRPPRVAAVATVATGCYLALPLVSWLPTWRPPFLCGGCRHVGYGMTPGGITCRPEGGCGCRNGVWRLPVCYRRHCGAPAQLPWRLSARGISVAVLRHRLSPTFPIPSAVSRYWRVSPSFSCGGCRHAVPRGLMALVAGRTRHRTTGSSEVACRNGRRPSPWWRLPGICHG